MERYPKGTRVAVWVDDVRETDRLPGKAIYGQGIVLRNAMQGEYAYEVALDGIDPGPEGNSHHYIYRESEVRRVRP